MKKLLILLCLLGITSVCYAQIKLDGVPDNVILTEEQKSTLKLGMKGYVHIEADIIKNDYIDDENRGTVAYNPKMKNYSYHKVIIPSNTTITNMNFSQKTPHTEAIQGKNLTFIECNLKNVEIDPTWTLVNSLAIHARYRTIQDGGKDYLIYEVEKDGIFEEVEREEIIN